VAVANQKNHASLYICGYCHIAPFKVKHPNIRTGKGCINFRDSDPLPVNNLKAFIKRGTGPLKGLKGGAALPYRWDSAEVQMTKGETRMIARLAMVLIVMSRVRSGGRDA
jgi:hypothetical protein